jgi:hypothetical protein
MKHLIRRDFWTGSTTHIVYAGGPDVRGGRSVQAAIASPCIGGSSPTSMFEAFNRSPPTKSGSEDRRPPRRRSR